MEFGVTEVLPNYSGGLGVLAGDHLKAASDLGVPLVAVGLLYRSGYFRQSLSLDGWQVGHYPSSTRRACRCTCSPTTPGQPCWSIGGHARQGACSAPGCGGPRSAASPCCCSTPTSRRTTPTCAASPTGSTAATRTTASARRSSSASAGCAPCAPSARRRATRTPTVFHTNEGHAGFLGLERIRELQDAEGLSFDEALAAVRAGTVFTTHTPVPAGIDRFPSTWCSTTSTTPRRRRCCPACRRTGVLALGAEDNPEHVQHGPHGPAAGPARERRLEAARSGLARDVRRLWSGFDTAEVPIGSVTNGVHGQTWEAREVTALIGPPGPHPAAQDGRAPSDAVLWAADDAARGSGRRGAPAGARGVAAARASAPELGWTDHVFDPEVLTVGFARRVPTYKRLTLMLRDPDRLRDMLLDPHRPVQLVVAGKAHPADDGGKALIQQIVRFADDPAVRHRIVFLPDYDMSMARYLYWGCDVWLNNPLRPLEACGTSGMKSALNGGLNLSIRDGWWDELYDGANGWAIPTADGVDDPHRRDDLEAERALRAARHPGGAGVLRPHGRRAGALGGPGAPHADDAASAGAGHPDGPRVRPGLVRARGRAAGGDVAEAIRAAREVAAYRARLNASWPKVSVLGVDASGLPDTPVVGAPMTVRASVALAGWTRRTSRWRWSSAGWTRPTTSATP